MNQLVTESKPTLPIGPLFLRVLVSIDVRCLKISSIFQLGFFHKNRRETEVVLQLHLNMPRDPGRCSFCNARSSCNLVCSSFCEEITGMKIIEFLIRVIKQNNRLHNTIFLVLEPLFHWSLRNKCQST